MTGQTISHYRVEEKIGEGGMGAVYRARDLQLNRNAAVKVLSAEVSSEERRRRFQQEALMASSLNHPHILTVYEAGEDAGRQYLITEYVDGGTLRDWSRREQPSVRQIVEMIAPLADGLACAHQAGILHRDIKPENILISRQGHAKLVDFGLAKLMEPAGDANLTTRSIEAAPSRPGVVVGTIPYMSPEQASGKPSDARADIFSFGAVLYELLTGQRPFVGKSDGEVMLAILQSQPRSLVEHRPEAPPDLRNIVEKALEKDPADRYQSMREMVVDLKRSLRARTSDSVPAVASQRRRRDMRGLVAVVITLLAAGVGAAWWLLDRADYFWKNPLASAQFRKLTNFNGQELEADISPDGKFVVFLADREGPFDAWIHQIGGAGFVNLTKGRVPGIVTEHHRGLGFTADGSEIWLRASGPTWVVPTIGGAPRQSQGTGFSLVPSPDGSQIVTYEHPQGRGEVIRIGDRNGRNLRLVFQNRFEGHCHYPIWSRDGRFIYFLDGLLPYEADIWRVPVTGGNAERITRHNSRVSHPTPLDDRTLLYVATAEDGSGPWIYAMDTRKRVAHRVSFGVDTYISVAAGSAPGSRPGEPLRRQVATVSNPTANLWTVPITPGVADDSAVEPFPVAEVRATFPRFGPDYVLYLSSRGGDDGLWKLKDGAATQLWNAGEGRLVAPPAVSSDGKLICLSIRKEGRNRLLVMSADGANVRPLADTLKMSGQASWSPDGQSILVAGDDGKGNGLFRVPLEGGTPSRFFDQVAVNPLASPDGRFILYSPHPGGSGHDVRTVTPFDLPRMQVTSLGDFYRFLPGGKQIVYMRGDLRHQNFWLLEVDGGRQRPLTSFLGGPTIKGFDISPDGKKILFDRVRENSDIVLIDLPPR
ncbi:MAG: protein kinase [Acidobacteria bacterium]|nr:protein kinase [Acidobacteriota bacterium]